METEIVRYRQATLVERIKITRKFTRWYFRSYKPITKIEDDDLFRCKHYYSSFTTVGMLLGGFLSFMARVVRIGFNENI